MIKTKEILQAVSAMMVMTVFPFFGYRAERKTKRKPVNKSKKIKLLFFMLLFLSCTYLSLFLTP